MYNKFPKQGECLWIGIAWDTIAEKIQNGPVAASIIAVILLYPPAKKYDKRDESSSRKSRPWNDQSQCLHYSWGY